MELSKTRSQYFYTWAIIINNYMKKAIFILMIIVMVSLLGCTVVKGPRLQQKTTIEIFTDEDAEDINNIKQIHIANLVVSEEKLDLIVIEGHEEIERLRTAIIDIQAKETLPLEVERYIDGNYLLVEIQVSKISEEYPYAVQYELLKYGYRSEIRVE